MGQAEAPRRRGVTLIELLLVVSIIGLLFGLLLPAVQSARESARRITCSAHLRQLAIATANYEARVGCLPPWQTTSILFQDREGYAKAAIVSPQTMLLPDIEENATFNGINFQSPFISLLQIQIEAVNVAAAHQVIAAFICPSDPFSRDKMYGPNSYRVAAGLCGMCASNSPRSPYDESGAFTLRGTSASEFADGLSSTVLVRDQDNRCEICES